LYVHHDASVICGCAWRWWGKRSWIRAVIEAGSDCLMKLPAEMFAL
jgi:hypothetical protein